jgi:hypothetical protein
MTNTDEDKGNPETINYTTFEKWFGLVWFGFISIQFSSIYFNLI